jgi:hypothetical protein
VKIASLQGEVPYRLLPPPPGIDHLVSTLTSDFNLLSEDTRTTEKVFFGTHRLLAVSPDVERFIASEQRYVSGVRFGGLYNLVKPQIEWLCQLFPSSRPFIVQCATLPVGKELLWHMDTYVYQSLSHKVHFPIITNTNSFYEFLENKARRQVHFGVGSAYEINNIWMHRSVNHGATPRTHVIIDMLEEEGWQRLYKGEDIIFSHHEENKKAEREYFK